MLLGSPHLVLFRVSSPHSGRLSLGKGPPLEYDHMQDPWLDLVLQEDRMEDQFWTLGGSRAIDVVQVLIGRAGRPPSDHCFGLRPLFSISH